MAISTERPLETTKKLLWLTPEAATNLAYCAHDVQDRFASEHARAISAKVLPALDVLAAKPGSRHEWYLSQMRAIIVSYANAMTHLKVQFSAEVGAAEVFLAANTDRLNQAQNLKVFFKGTYKITSAFAVGFFMFLTAKVASNLGWVPPELVNQKGHTDTALSLMVAAASSGAVALVQNWWSNYAQNRIGKEYDSLLMLAHLRYAEGLLQLLDMNWQKMCTLWEWYTGKEWGEMPAYMRSNRANVDFVLRRRQLLAEKAQSNIVYMVGTAIKGMMAGIGRLRKKKVEELQ